MNKYSLQIPDDVYLELEKLANKRGVSVSDLLKDSLNMNTLLDTSVVDRPANRVEYAIEIISLVVVMLISAVVLYGLSWICSL